MAIVGSGTLEGIVDGRRPAGNTNGPGHLGRIVRATIVSAVVAGLLISSVPYASAAPSERTKRPWSAFCNYLSKGQRPYQSPNAFTGLWGIPFGRQCYAYP